jgi:hypothetical protein
VAEVLVRSLLTDTAVGRTFELFAEAGAAPSDWNGVFADLRPDSDQALDASTDDEPPVVRADLARLAGR